MDNCRKCVGCIARGIVADLAREETRAGKLSRFVVSFSRPSGSAGGVIVSAFGTNDAFYQVLMRDIRPSGDFEVAISAVPEKAEIPETSMNRLLEDVEMRLLGMVLVNVGTGRIDAGKAQA